MAGYMRVSGKMIKGMAEVMNDTQMEIFIKVNFNMEKLMEKEGINGYPHQKYMMVSGLREWDTAMEFGSGWIKIVIKSIRIHILESGEMVKLKDTEYILGVMGIDMKVNGKNAWKMVEVLIFLQMEINTQDNIKMVSQKAMEYILGQMVITMMGNSLMVSKKARVNGRNMWIRIQLL